MSASRDPLRRRFAANLRMHRAAVGLSQEELAFKAEIHRTQISLIESGQRLPRLDTFIRIRGTLGVSNDDLLSGIDYDPVVLRQGGIRITEPDGMKTAGGHGAEPDGRSEALTDEPPEEKR